MRLTFFDFVSVLMLVVTELPVVLFVCAPAHSLLCSAIGISSVLVVQLCSMVHLVGVTIGSLHGRLQCQIRCQYSCFLNMFGHQGMSCGCSPP